MRKAPPLPESDNTVAHGSDFVRAIGDRDSVRSGTSTGKEPRGATPPMRKDREVRTHGI